MIVPEGLCYIDLDRARASITDEVPIREIMMFPGGEPHIKINPIEAEEVVVNASVNKWEDFGYLCMLLSALAHQDKRIHLILPYFPGARQDRNPDGLTPLTVEFYAMTLSLYVRSITVFDIHSPLARQSIENFIPYARFYDPMDLPGEGLPQDIQYIIAPDAGAANRAQWMQLTHYPNAQLIQCEKKRDFDSGKFIGYTLPDLESPGNYLVVDDICDGGGTFHLLAQAFAEQPLVAKFSKLQLFVSHGIFSKPIASLIPPYDHVYFTDSRASASDRILFADMADFIAAEHHFSVLSLNWMRQRVIDDVASHNEYYQ